MTSTDTRETFVGPVTFQDWQSFTSDPYPEFGTKITINNRTECHAFISISNGLEQITYEMEPTSIETIKPIIAGSPYLQVTYQAAAINKDWGFTYFKVNLDLQPDNPGYHAFVAYNSEDEWFSKRYQLVKTTNETPIPTPDKPHERPAAQEGSLVTLVSASALVLGAMFYLGL
jgi:hypothetical protein